MARDVAALDAAHAAILNARLKHITPQAIQKRQGWPRMPSAVTTAVPLLAHEDRLD
jgi:hypothetical protein